MNKIEHTVELRGAAGDGAEVRPETAGYLLVRLHELVRDSIRMGVLHSSRRQGRPIKELAPAWEEIRFKGQSDGLNGATLLHYMAPRLQDAAAGLFAQGRLFDDVVAADDTGFDLAGRMLADVADRRKNSLRFDSPILERVIKFSKVIQKGVDTLHLSGHKLNELRCTDINAEVIASAQTLYQETPAPHRVRVAGRLDMIRVSDRVFELVLPGEQRIRAIWTATGVVHLKDYLTQDILIEGSAIYRPSGSLLRIDAESILPATQQDMFFAHVPQAPTRTLDVGDLYRRQTEKNGVNTIWATWDGEETEEELLAALEEIR